MKDLLILRRRAERGAYTSGVGEDNGVDDPKPRRYERADRPGLWKWWRATQSQTLRIFWKVACSLSLLKTRKRWKA